MKVVIVAIGENNMITKKMSYELATKIQPKLLAEDLLSD